MPKLCQQTTSTPEKCDPWAVWEYKAFVCDNICSLGQPSIMMGTCCAVNDLPLLSFDINLLGWKTWTWLTYSNLLFQFYVQRCSSSNSSRQPGCWFQFREWGEAAFGLISSKWLVICKSLVKASLQWGLNRAAVIRCAQKCLQFSCLITITLLPCSLVFILISSTKPPSCTETLMCAETFKHAPSLDLQTKWWQCRCGFADIHIDLALMKQNLCWHD